MAKKKGKERQPEGVVPPTPSAPASKPPSMHASIIPGPPPSKGPLSEVLEEEEESPLPVRIQSPLIRDQLYSNGGYDAWPGDDHDAWENGQGERQEEGDWRRSGSMRSSNRQRYEDNRQRYEDGSESLLQSPESYRQSNAVSRQGTHAPPTPQQGPQLSLEEHNNNALDMYRGAPTPEPTPKVKPPASKVTSASTGLVPEPWGSRPESQAPASQPAAPLPPSGGRNWPMDTSAYAPKTSAGAAWAKSHPPSTTMHHPPEEQHNPSGGPPAWKMWGKELGAIQGPKVAKVNPLHAAPAARRPAAATQYSSHLQGSSMLNSFPSSHKNHHPSQSHGRAYQQDCHEQHQRPGYPGPQHSGGHPQSHQANGFEEEHRYGYEEEYHSGEDMSYDEGDYNSADEEGYDEARRVRFRQSQASGQKPGKKADHWGTKPSSKYNESDAWGGNGKSKGDAWGKEPSQEWGAKSQGDTWGAPSKGKGDAWGKNPLNDGWGEKGGDGWGKPQSIPWDAGSAKPRKKGGGDGWQEWDDGRRGSKQSNHRPAKGEAWGAEGDGWGQGDQGGDDWVQGETDDGWGTNGGGGWAGDGGSDWDHSHKRDQLASRKDDIWSTKERKSSGKPLIRENGPTYNMPSRTLAYALDETTTKLDEGPERPTGMGNYADIRFLESHSKALEPVEDAFWGQERQARDRIHWMFSPDKDERVSSILAWIQGESYQLAAFGLDKFLQTRERGALLVNADYRDPKYPNQPAFDWLNFPAFQETKDRILQESVAFYDPMTQVIVFVFLPSKSGKSVAIWRRKLPLGNNVRLAYNSQIAIATGALRKPSDYVIHLDSGGKDYERKKAVAPAPELVKKTSKAKKKPPPAAVDADGKKLKKRKWWQIRW